MSFLVVLGVFFGGWIVGVSLLRGYYRLKVLFGFRLTLDKEGKLQWTED